LLIVVNPIVCLEQVVLQLPDGGAHTELNCGKLKWMTNHCISASSTKTGSEPHP
jgi:hypothetical protein